MKKLVYILAFYGGIVLTAQAQTKDTAKKDTAKVVAPNPNAADISFEKDAHDYGTIKQGANGTYDFKFTNTGKEPLIISNAKGSCGCTVPEWPKEPIKPGATGVIKTTYDTKRIGAFTKTVTITSNAKTATKVLTIKGVVEEPPKEQTMPLKKVEEGATPLENSKMKF